MFRGGRGARKYSVLSDGCHQTVPHSDTLKMVQRLSLAIAIVVCVRVCYCEHIRQALRQLEEDVTYFTNTFEDSQENVRVATQKLKDHVAKVVQTQDEQGAMISRLQYAIVEVAELTTIVDGVQRLLEDLDGTVSAPTGFSDGARPDLEMAARTDDLEDTAKVLVEQIEVLSTELNSASKIIEEDFLVKRKCFEVSDSQHGSHEEQRTRICNVAETRVPEHCAELYRFGYREDGVFTTRLGTRFLETYCDMTSDLGGWNVILRTRSRVIVSHERSTSLSPLLHVLGSVHGDFWWGLRNVLSLVSHADFELALELTGSDTVLVFDSFVARQEGNHYVISLTHGSKTTTRRLIIEDGGLRVEEADDGASDVKQTVCPNAITHVFYLGSETVTLDVTCLTVVFAGVNTNGTDAVVKIRPKKR
ncbi:uncharacterized protein LOC135367318 isoform X2 [Ornithodoros turicata]|uniref:uncharacterized protein LOC135367318 isoform X2 n=1 Tax=Ornithodoros turicata TaxID=34597 RepID=UPI003139EE96